MPYTAARPEIVRDAPIPTKFGVGGAADRFARPESLDELRACLDLDPSLRVLGSGANLLVDDPGVAELVVRLDAPFFRRVEFDDASGLVRAGAGADLARLILDCTRRGLAGIQGLAGVPASLAGAVRMNAGGRFGEISDVVRSVRVLDRQGTLRTIAREDIAFAYRTSGLNDAIIVEVELALTRDDPTRLRRRLLEVMASKKSTQPMGEKSAGCCFRNPVLVRTVEGIGCAGQRVGAGMLIDRAGCKGLRVGGARVSEHHANFITATRDARAHDILMLMDEVADRVEEKFALRLRREVVVWSRS